MDNVSAASLLGGVKTNVGPYLSGLTTLLPTSVTGALKPFLGSGSGPFGNPSMSDMMGTVSGKHTADFSSAGSQLASIASSSQGQSFASAMTAVMAAVSSGTGIAAALAALSTASSTFSSAAASNSSLSGAMSSISGSMSNVTGHLSLEQSNLSQAGLSLASIPTSSGAGSILSFASKLHSFGEDKMQLGHADIFNGVATNDLSGDALKAALLEGKNVSAMSGAGKSPPTVSNTQAALTAANSSGLDASINNVNSLFATYKQAKATNDSDLAKFKDIQGQLQANPGDAGLTQQLATAKQTALTSLNAQTDAYLAFTTANDKLSDMIFTASPADMQKIQTAKESYTVS
jgi:hypothetical protein